jgi:CheY-like chemotaxis protein
MNKSTRVALQGFSRAERSTFESFFALAGQRTPSYAQEADPTRAHFILVDADDAASCELLTARGLMGRAVALGAKVQAEALMQLPRPINLMLVVRALDALPRSAARPRTPSGADPEAMGEASALQPSDAIDRVLQELAYRTVALPGGVDYRAAAASAGPTAAKPPEAARALSPQPVAAARPSSRPAGVAAPSAPTSPPTARPAPASHRSEQRAEANLAPGLERPHQGTAGAPSRPFANTEGPTITSVDIPVWADARAITAGLAAQAAAEAWPTLVAPPETSTALWLPDLQESPARATASSSAPAPAKVPAPSFASASASASASTLARAPGPVRAPTPAAAPGRALAPAWAPRAWATQVPVPASASASAAQSVPTPVRLSTPTPTTTTTPTPTPTPSPSPSPSPSPALAPTQSLVAHPAAPLATITLETNPFPTLPCLELPAEPAAEAPVAAPSPSAAREANGAAHVLVVDDGDLALRFISTQLKRYGFQVHVAREPREALAQLQVRCYEFVFIEINLETDSNFPVTQAVRQVPLGPGEKAAAVVLLADRHSNSELQAAANAGADAWLTTPLLETDLSKLVGPRLAPRAQTADNELRSAAYP